MTAPYSSTMGVGHTHGRDRFNVYSASKSRPWIFLFENPAPRDCQYHAQFRVVVVADDLTVSLVPLSSTRPHGVSRFFGFATQVFKIVWRIVPYNFKIRAKSSL